MRTDFDSPAINLGIDYGGFWTGLEMAVEATDGELPGKSRSLFEFAASFLFSFPSWLLRFAMAANAFQ